MERVLLLVLWSSFKVCINPSPFMVQTVCCSFLKHTTIQLWLHDFGKLQTRASALEECPLVPNKAIRKSSVEERTQINCHRYSVLSLSLSATLELAKLFTNSSGGRKKETFIFEEMLCLCYRLFWESTAAWAVAATNFLFSSSSCFDWFLILIVLLLFLLFVYLDQTICIIVRSFYFFFSIKV